MIIQWAKRLIVPPPKPVDTRNRAAVATVSHCSAIDCAVPTELFMCGRHFRMIPPGLRDQLRNAVLAGVTGEGEQSRLALLAAAVKAVASREGKTICPIGDDGRRKAG